MPAAGLDRIAFDLEPGDVLRRRRSRVKTLSFTQKFPARPLPSSNPLRTSWSPSGFA
ncbi:hypothetical protein HMPREF0185_01068 [Brevundimonas diminuta 470-4]|nr:hypothetical protein HMPREF0185_01068 [Brevundimonas diminuta 470-4]